MKDERIGEVLAYIAKVLREDFGAAPVRLTEYESGRRNFVRSGAGFSHVLWMCEEALRLLAAGRVKKACRWLGFIQGFLWCQQVFSVTDLRNMSRDRPAGVPTYKAGDVVCLKRSPGVRHRILSARPSGYTCSDANHNAAGRPSREWDTETMADPFYASGEWELEVTRPVVDLWSGEPASPTAPVIPRPQEGPT